VSNASLTRWHATEQALGSPVLSNQVGYSLIAEQDLLRYARAHHRVIIAYRPLELGLLSGDYPDTSSPANPSGQPLRCSCRRTSSAPRI